MNCRQNSQKIFFIPSAKIVLPGLPKEFPKKYTAEILKKYQIRNPKDLSKKCLKEFHEKNQWSNAELITGITAGIFIWIARAIAALISENKMA